MTRALVTAALLATLVAPAQADVWKQASDPTDTTTDFYNTLMQKGDDAAIAAATDISRTVQLRQVELALESYRAAAKLRPTAAEPQFRIASTLNAFFIDCDYTPYIHKREPPKTCGPGAVDRASINRFLAERDVRSREMMAAWDAFEALAPLDPRVTEVLQSRAIQRTKMVAAAGAKTKELLQAAERDYRTLLEHDDGIVRLDQDGRLSLVLGNLAETYMMLGDIDQAIANYLLAAKAGADGTTLLGLAVALDRDERGAEALRIIRDFGYENFENFQKRFAIGSVFFVPAGEEHYYFALGHEAFGEIPESIEAWRSFIASGAHPQFQPRAKEHLDKLLLRKNLKIEIPISRDLGRAPVITPSRPRIP